jgi:hypothetical protein
MRIVGRYVHMLQALMAMRIMDLYVVGTGWKHDLLGVAWYRGDMGARESLRDLSRLQTEQRSNLMWIGNAKDL